MLLTAVSLVEERMNGNTHITVSKKDLQVYVKLASVLKSNYTRLPEALQFCHRAAEWLPFDFRAIRETGHVLLHMGKFPEAKMYLEHALEINPTEPNVNFLLGVALGELGDLDRAEVSIRRAMRLGSGNKLTYIPQLAIILRRKGKMEEAEALIARLSSHTL